MRVGGSGRGLEAERQDPRGHEKRSKAKRGRTRNLPLRVSRRWRSTALCVARRSAVLALREGLRLIWAALALSSAAVVFVVGCGEVDCGGELAESADTAIATRLRDFSADASGVRV